MDRQEFQAGRAQAAIGLDVGEADYPLGAARLLELRRRRHEPFPDYQQWLWVEMADWVAEELDRRAASSWNVREELYRFPDGWTVETVSDKGDQEREGLLMRNCVGADLTKPTMLGLPMVDPMEPGDVIVSLRDESGMPHASAVFRDGALWELSGKASSVLKPEYRDRMRRFLESVEASSGNRLVRDWTCA